MRGIALYDSLRRGPAELAPADGQVNIYSCGPLVLNSIHLGHLRQYVNVDLLKRGLLAKGYRIRHVLTITDIARNIADDTSQRARTTTDGFFADLAALAVLPVDEAPRLSQHIEPIIAAATRLEQADRAYRTATGLYFDTAASAGYGKLSGLVVDQQRPGQRREPDLGALRSPNDFAVWRQVEPDEERGWQSPWGYGIPGWHIPCTTMANLYLDRIDVHTGVDHHRRLHHVNELVQAEALDPSADPWVQHWHHTAELTLSGGRMTRDGDRRPPSLVTVAEWGIEPADVRYLMLTGHYRQRLNLDETALASARRSRLRLRGRIARKTLPKPRCRPQFASVRTAVAGNDVASRFLDDIDAALCRDVNVPRLVALAHELARARTVAPADEAELWQLLDGLLGLELTAPDRSMPVAGHV